MDFMTLDTKMTVMATLPSPYFNSLSPLSLEVSGARVVMHLTQPLQLHLQLMHSISTNEILETESRQYNR
jgi:hypothetical protein